MSQPLQVAQFESRLRSAVDRARVVLETAKAPCLAGGVHHRFEDKYLVAEHVTNAAAASQLNSLAALGVTPEHLARLKEWAQARAAGLPASERQQKKRLLEASSISLRFRAEERCSFLREVTRDEEGPTRTEHTTSIEGTVRSALTSKVVTKITEYFWKLEVSYELLAVRGVGEQPADRLTLLARTGRDELKTAAKQPPRPEAKIPALEREVPVRWLFQQLSAEDGAPRFKVDRSNKACHTPRRNPEINTAAGHFHAFAKWAWEVSKYIEGFFRLQTQGNKNPYEGAASQDTSFVPVLPLMEVEGEEETARVLGPVEANQLLAEEVRSLAERRKELREAFPEGTGLATAAEALLVLDTRHCVSTCEEWQCAVDYVEGLIRKQLIAAIGKEVTPADFAEYMRFHNRKLFAEAFAPSPFCFAVRRSGKHAPEGTVSIEQMARGGGGDGHIPDPIFTFAAKSARPHDMDLPLSASTKVRFEGERYLHAWLSHTFSGKSAERLSLVSRARQFSSMLVLVGRIASATSFEPTYAAIVKNKDELAIPLDLSTIPTPKEFKDAIESLSPEQQAFAKAFRSMQLESTLFGVLVIQIKPQLERVLNLHPDSLTKEIKLTQELMDLFSRYQIPSDLLSFEADPGDMEVVGGGPTAKERLEAVRGHVKAMNEMIAGAKEEELAQRRMEARYAAPVDEDDDEDDSGAMEADQEKTEKKQKEKEMDCKPRSVMGMKKQCVSQVARKIESMQMQSLTLSASAAAAGPAQACARQQPQEAAPAQRPQPQRQPERGSVEATEEEVPEVDYTQLPQEMDRRFERLDVDGALRPTVITAADTWTRRAQKALLASPELQVLGPPEQKTEKDAAFDLLDALTKSGALPVEHASLHIVVAATHCFDKSVMDTVVQDNVSPIDKVERSTLIMATTVHGQPAAALVREAQCQRLRTSSPMLFLEDL